MSILTPANHSLAARHQQLCRSAWRWEAPLAAGGGGSEPLIHPVNLCLLHLELASAIGVPPF
jgi:hypothetical protein